MTSNNAKLDKIKARIKALSSRTIDRGCTEAEAASAAELMGKLLQEYSLTMSEVDVRAANCRTLELCSGAKVRPAIHGVFSSIGLFTDCKVWYNSRNFEFIRYFFFGQESDLQAADYLFRIISRSLETEAAHFKTTSTYALSRNRRDATQSFKLAMADRVAHRLRDMKAERDAATQRAAGMGSSLVVLKNQVVTEEYAALNLRIKKKAYRPTARSSAAIDAGRAAGDRVNLGRPVDGAGSHLSLAEPV